MVSTYWLRLTPIIFIECLVFLILPPACQSNDVEMNQQLRPSTTSNVISQYSQLTADGIVELKSREPVKLAGIKMRNPEAIEEKNNVSGIDRIIVSGRATVRIEKVGPLGEALVFYSQPILYRDTYLPYHIVLPRTVDCSINELLLALGIADFDENSSLPDDIQSRFKSLTLDYARAVYRGRPSTSIEELVRHPSQIYWFRHGLQANVRLGDRKYRGSPEWWRKFSPNPPPPTKTRSTHEPNDSAS